MIIALKRYNTAQEVSEWEPLEFVFPDRMSAALAIAEDVAECCADVEDLDLKEAADKIKWTSPMSADCEYSETEYKLYEVTMK